AGIIVDRKGVAPELTAIDLEIPAAAREVVFPRIAWEQHANPTVRVHAEDRDVGVLIEPEKEPHPLTAGNNGPLATIGPQFDARKVGTQSPPDARRGHEGQAEPSNSCEREASCRAKGRDCATIRLLLNYSVLLTWP